MGAITQPPVPGMTTAGPTGPAGADGKTWYGGTVAPDNAVGVNGDWYMRLNGDIHKKVGGAWALQFNNQGAAGSAGAAGVQGPIGNTGAAGATGPAGASGAPAATFDEPFTTDTIAAYTGVAGTSLAGLSITGGVLTTTDANDHLMANSAVNVTDARHCVKVIPGASNNIIAAIYIKYVDANNYISLQQTPGALSLLRVVAGAATLISLVAIAGGAIAGGVGSTKPFWIVGRMEQDVVQAELHLIDPRLGSNPTAGAQMILGGTAKTNLGAGVAGKPALRLCGYNNSILTTTDWAMDDWIVAPPFAARASF